MKTLIHWLLSALAVMIAAYLLPGIVIKSFFVALIVAVVLGFFNMIVRPILIVLTLPINILTLGLFTFVINAAMVLFTSDLVPGFYVKNFTWAFLFSIVLWLVNMILHKLEHDDNRLHE